MGGEEDCTTLELFCRDETLGMEVQLLYTVFEEEDAITRSVIVKNAGNSNIYLEKVLSTCLDMDDRNFEVIGLFGSWGRERHIQRMPVGYGRQNIASFKGESGHQEHPFMALVTPETNQDIGEVYANEFCIFW